MTNGYFTPPDPLVSGTNARASQVNDRMTLVEASFDKLPAEEVLKQGRVTFGTGGGTANVQTVDLPHNPAAYVNGLMFTYVPAATNTGAATINVDGLGAIGVKRIDGSALVAGDLTEEVPVAIIYLDGEFRVMSYDPAIVHAAAVAAATTAGSTAGATAGETAGTTAGTAAGATAGEAAGAAAGETAGAAAGATAGAAAGATAGAAAGAAAAAAGSQGMLVELFDTSGVHAWSPAAEATFVEVHLFAGGAGGNSGAKAATGVSATGGGGGGAGGYTMGRFAASELPASLNITVGAGGAGGAGSTAAYVPGSAGGNSSFGSLLLANGGAIGTNATNAGTGGSGILSGSAGGSGSTGSAAGNAASTANGNSNGGFAAAGGGGGGGTNTLDATQNGGAGGTISSVFAPLMGLPTTGGAGGTGAGGAGANGAASNSYVMGGRGGGGGASNGGAGAAGNGGNGGFPGGGGGGGGGGRTGFGGGNGGNGAAGRCVVITYFGYGT